ncbi:hypothetical protein GCM10018780_88930 [Streptomyces lanatus]|nr:hypothetical protein GCM10018780_88930 [Streptomyces lanatus]
MRPALVHGFVLVGASVADPKGSVVAGSSVGNSRACRSRPGMWRGQDGGTLPISAMKATGPLS